MLLLNEPARDRVHCRFCDSRRIVVVSTKAADGAGLTLVSCQACQKRSWAGEDGRITLEDVTGRARQAVPPCLKGAADRGARYKLRCG